VCISSLLLCFFLLTYNTSETDLDEVLQSKNVFSNVSKGVMAKRSDLQRAFNTTDDEKCCLIVSYICICVCM
jgi:ribosome maturation protein Sdo1